MKNFSGLLLIVVLFIQIFTFNTFAQNNSSAKNEEQKLRQLEDDWLSCYISGDKEKYNRIVAEEFTGTDESAVFRTKEKERALLPTTPIPNANAVNEEIQIKFYKDFAVVTGRIITKAKIGDREIIGFKTRFTDTWLKRRGIWQVVARHYSRYPIERTAIKLESNLLDKFVGEYEVAPGVNFSVSKEPDKLFGNAPGQNKMEFLPESDFVFFTKETPSALFIFTRDEKGQFAQLMIIQDGRVTLAKKVK